MSNYPNFLEDPHTGLVDEGTHRVRCKKCIKYGEICTPEFFESAGGPLSVRRELFPDDYLDQCMIIKPCTVCAIANGGWWGWTGEQPGEGVKEETGGVFPGYDGISDVLSEHSKDVGDRDQVHQLAHDYQVILGFVQYAHYNHLKWSDIIEPSGEVDLDEYKSEHDGPRDDEDHHWYWWKLIPKNLSLPERYRDILIQMIVRYKDPQEDGCVPKTMQKVSGSLSDELWPDFWATFVEPSHVAWIYRETMNHVLTEHRSNVQVALHGENTKTLLKKDICNFEIRNIRSRDIGSSGVGRQEGDDLRSHVLAEDIGIILDTFLDAPHDEGMEFFLIWGGYEQWETQENVQRSLLKIKDRDIFGGYLNDLVDCRHDDFSYGWLQNIQRPTGPDPRFPSERDFWNLVDHSGFQKLFDNVYKMIGFENTSYWEDVQRVMDERVVSDYTNELYYRQYLEEEGEAWSDNPLAGQIAAAYWGEYEVEDGEVNSSTQGVVSQEKMVEKLKEIQTMVDDSVKDSVSEGVYLELVNKMCDMYKLIKEIQEI
jgi:hypothetical protein